MTSVKDVKINQPTSILSQTLDDAFPNVDPGEVPLGSRALLQVKQPPLKTKSGFVLSKYDIETEFDNTQVAKVIALGPVCFKNRSTLEAWPEGDWVEVGAYVRISQHDGKRWTRPLAGTRGIGMEERVTFALVDDLLLQSLVIDPMSVKAFF